MPSRKTLYAIARMNPIIETRPPFVIKVYDTYFHVSWDGLTDKTEDRYSYDKVKSISIKKGKFNKTWAAVDLLADIAFNLGTYDTNDSDELQIELETGEVETRYLQSESADKIVDAVELIKTKISKSV
jgi:hypothetical protein